MRISYKDLKIRFCEHVYEPREDSFLLADNLDIKKTDKVLDVGTGTGIQALIAAKKAKEVTAVDFNKFAVKCAKENAKLNKLKNITVFGSNLFSRVKGKYDLITFNPPYLPTKSEDLAWDGGQDGREVINRFLNQFEKHLSKNGRVLMIGASLSDYKKTISILRKKEFRVSIKDKKKLPWEEIVVISANK